MNNEYVLINLVLDLDLFCADIKNLCRIYEFHLEV